MAIPISSIVNYGTAFAVLSFMAWNVFKAVENNKPDVPQVIYLSVEHDKDTIKRGETFVRTARFIKNTNCPAEIVVSLIEKDPPQKRHIINRFLAGNIPADPDKIQETPTTTTIPFRFVGEYLYDLVYIANCDGQIQAIRPDNNPIPLTIVKE